MKSAFLCRGTTKEHKTLQTATYKEAGCEGNNNVQGGQRHCRHSLETYLLIYLQHKSKSTTGKNKEEQNIIGTQRENGSQHYGEPKLHKK